MPGGVTSASCTVSKMTSITPSPHDGTITACFAPQWLTDAHANVDAAVATAYGWKTDVPDSEALDALMALNLASAP